MFARWDYNQRGGLGTQSFMRQELAFQLSAGSQPNPGLHGCSPHPPCATVPAAPSGYIPSNGGLTRSWPPGQPFRQPGSDPRGNMGNMLRMPGGSWEPSTRCQPDVRAPAQDGCGQPVSQRAAEAARLDSSAMMIGGSGNAIRFGSGNDRLSVVGGQDHAAIMGGGDDRVSLEGTRNVTIDAGAGNDRIMGNGVRDAWINPGEGHNAVIISGDGIRVDASRGSNMIMLAGDENHVEGAGPDDFIVRLTTGREGFRFA